MREELVSCDVCEDEYESEDLFWIVDGMTEDQYLVAEYLTQKGVDNCCESCFKAILKQINLEKIELQEKIDQVQYDLDHTNDLTNYPKHRALELEYKKLLSDYKNKFGKDYK